MCGNCKIFSFLSFFSAFSWVLTTSQLQVCDFRLVIVVVVEWLRFFGFFCVQAWIMFVSMWRAVVWSSAYFVFFEGLALITNFLFNPSLKHKHFWAQTHSHIVLSSFALPLVSPVVPFMNSLVICINSVLLLPIHSYPRYRMWCGVVWIATAAATRAREVAETKERTSYALNHLFIL